MGVDRPIDITTDQRKTILALLKRHLPNTTAWIYGSRVKWTSRPQSDLDLVVFTKPDQERRVSELREAFEESNLPFRVDLFVWDTVPKQFRKQIEADHVVLVEKEEQRGDAEWVRRKIGTLGRVVTGKTPPTVEKSNFDGPYPFITIPDLDGRVLIDNTERTLSDKGAAVLRTCLLPPGAVLMSCIATVGRCGVTARPSFTNQQINSVIPGGGVDSRFLYYVFTQLGHELESTGGGGSVYTNVSKSRFSDIEVLMPVDLAEQRAIAHVLGTLDDKIELNRRMNETLESMARALFKSWFIDFDPVRAKMAGRAPGLPQHLADLFPDCLVDSELGPIPEGWEVKPLNKILTAKDVRVGKDDMPEYSSTNTGLHQRSEYFKKQLSKSNSKNKLIHEGDLVFGLSRQVLNFGLMRDSIGCVSPAYKVFAINNHIIVADMLERMMRIHTNYFYGAISASSREGQAISSDALGLLNIVRPTDAVQKAFYTVLDPFLSQVNNLQKKSRILATQRDALLPKLISGELRAKNAERLIEEAKS